MAGAEPLYLSSGFILEEGFPIADLRRIVASMAKAASEAGVAIVTGDTKVVQRGKADGVFINTAGIGIIRSSRLIGQAQLQPGDRVLLSGPVGDHGIAIMMAREALGNRNRRAERYRAAPYAGSRAARSGRKRGSLPERPHTRRCRDRIERNGAWFGGIGCP